MKKILIFANNDIGLYKFRKELIEKLIKENEVYVSLPKGNYNSKLSTIGCKVIETEINRRGTNPITDLKLLFNYKKIIKEVDPEVVLTYTIKPNIYGGVASRILNVPCIANITGLGTALEKKGTMQKIILMLYKIALKKASCTFFQNQSNREFFIKNKIVKGETKLIPGSGVNLEEHKLEVYPEKYKSIKFLFIGRIMMAKGINELLNAAEITKEKYPEVHFDLVGAIEENYIKVLNEYEDRGIIKYHGLQENVHEFIKNSHATILPSYHEGTANVLLETAASGRPVLASKVPGCIETFDNQISGLGFEVRNVDSLVCEIINFINLPYEKKVHMGINGRRKMEKEYDRNIVIKAYVEEINKIN
ncbi:glycosyltransferase family 1 protein [Sutcliffiella horikoshii]|uniref:Glycosyltransferase family 1 protein n=1 Tax=Sutcliffiella horikoshii TaxID=79883 RepID=A0ABN4ZL45_9BACI|nr:glycosyltransferase family 4 protein [Sutcliffiella horikoshii]ART78204.1 glycosyltransferase family 1 protein [Sutcliffiella horikoshii]